MSFKILYVTATTLEAEALKRTEGILEVNGAFRFGHLEIELLITGVGSISTAWAIKQWFTVNGKPDLAVNGGIAGSYNEVYKPGDVVTPLSDCFADAGIEDGDRFFTLSEAGLASADEFPFRNGLLYSDLRYIEKLKNLISPVRAITVNTATGSESSGKKLLNKFNPDIETMEGATFFYICSMENVPFLALRAISNKVERRNRNAWKIDLAINNLSEKLRDVLLTFE